MILRGEISFRSARPVLRYVRACRVIGTDSNAEAGRQREHVKVFRRVGFYLFVEGRNQRRVPDAIRKGMRFDTAEVWGSSPHEPTTSSFNRSQMQFVASSACVSRLCHNSDRAKA